MKCSCCGAPVNYNSYGDVICGYCGNTELSARRNYSKNFGAIAKVDEQVVKRLDNDSQRRYGENIRKELINKLAEEIAKSIETEHYTEDDICSCEVYTVCKGKIVVEFRNS